MKLSKVHLGLISLVCVGLTQLAVFAGNIEDSPLGKGGDSQNSGGGIGDTLRMFGALVIVAGVLWIAYKFMMKFSKRSLLGQGGSDKLKVLQSKAISPKHSVVLLQAGEKVLLLGLSPSSVSNLCELENLKDIEELEKDFITDKSQKEKNE